MARGSKQKALKELIAPLAKQVAESKKRTQDKAKSNDNPPPDDGVNDFAAKHGDYERNMRFVVNRGGTAIDRWRTAGKLSDSQLAGILHCQHLWARIGSQSIVADFDRIRGMPHGDGVSQHEALTSLGRIASDFPPTYWDVFENVCRHDLPAGVAGSRLANVRRSAEIAARCVVCFIADIIAMKERLSY
jgi:hypothetical protein